MRRAAGGRLGGLRFVRNWMGYHPSRLPAVGDHAGKNSLAT